MEIIKYPGREEWSSLIKRPALDVTTLFDTVRTVLDEVREQGDIAVKAYEEKFDKVLLSSLQVSEEEMREADALVAEDLKQAIRTAKANIEKFHASQRFEGKKVETTPGVTCWQKAVAIEKVGLYIPGGTAPLFSTVLMLAVPARIAGCKEIVLCTPPNREGKVHPAILFAAEVAGVSKIFKAGGIQAIAAMAYGTESVPKVYKIFGPGNQYVTAAKQLVSLKEVAIDMPAGPSEVEVIADETANPDFIAADFLSQAEHGVDSQAILVTASETIVEPVARAIQEQLNRLPRKEITEKSLAHSRIIVLKDSQEVVDFSDGADRGARVAARGLLFQRDGGGKSFDLVDVRLVHLREELAGVGGKGFHIPALAFRIDDVERECGFARSRRAADDHKFVAGDVEREVLEVVLARALDMDGGMTHEVP